MVWLLKGEQGGRQADHGPPYPESLIPLTTSVTGEARLLTTEELTSMTGEQFGKLWDVGGLIAQCLYVYEYMSTMLIAA